MAWGAGFQLDSFFNSVTRVKKIRVTEVGGRVSTTAAEISSSQRLFPSGLASGRISDQKNLLQIPILFIHFIDLSQKSLHNYTFQIDASKNITLYVKC